VPDDVTQVFGVANPSQYLRDTGTDLAIADQRTKRRMKPVVLEEHRFREITRRLNKAESQCLLKSTILCSVGLQFPAKAEQGQDDNGSGSQNHSQPNNPTIVYTNVMRRSAKLSSGLVLAATMLVGFHQANASQPVHRFFEYYQAVEKVEKTETPINFWERVVCSFLLTRAEAREGKPPIS
jgi:hypothetical protein